MSAPAPAPAPAAEPELRVISAEEVAKHATDSDCWCILGGLVYNLSDFLSDHPGGPESITVYAGADGTSEFEDIGHSPSARTMMKKYLIGRLPETDMSNPTVASASKAGVSKSSDSAKSSGSSITGLLPYAIPVGMLVFAVWFHFFNKTAAAAL